MPVTAPDRLVTHVRLTIHPDGGVARLRVFGEVVPDPRRLGGRVDLAATCAGGRVEACSNMFFSRPANVLAPGRAQVMSDGWETARRRDDGHDWLVVAAGGAGRAAPRRDRHHPFRRQRAGPAPGSATRRPARNCCRGPGWSRTPSTGSGSGAPARAGLVRLDIYPDGGISRLRLVGVVPPDRREQIARRWLGLLPADVAAGVDQGEFFD